MSDSARTVTNEESASGVLNLLSGNGTVGILMKASEDARKGELSVRKRADPEDRSSSPVNSGRNEDLRILLRSLKAMEYYNDAFYEGNVLRSNFIGLVTEIVTALVIILAVKHTDKLTSPIFSSPYITIILLIFLASALAGWYYYFDHWQTLLELARRSRQEAVEEEAKATDVGTHDQLERDALETTWQVRLASGEIFIGALKVPLGLVNKFFTYILVAVMLAAINTAFSDGQWIVPKVTVLLEIVIIIFVDYTASGYRRDSVARSIRLRGRGG